MKIHKLNKPFSMSREFHFFDWITLANAVCGTGAMFSMLTYLQVSHIYFACVMLFAALVFDILDGRIARWRQKTSKMARELDSLADVISFGVAPAIIGYGCGMQGLCDRIILPILLRAEYAAWHATTLRPRRCRRPEALNNVTAAGTVDVPKLPRREQWASPSGSERP